MDTTEFLKSLTSNYEIICSKKVAKKIKDDPAYSGIPVRIKKWARYLYLVDKSKFEVKLPKDYYKLSSLKY